VNDIIRLLLKHPGILAIPIAMILLTFWLTHRGSDKKTTSKATTFGRKCATYVTVILFWGISAFIAYVVAMLSINETVIATVIWSSIGCLVVALVLAFAQKKYLAFSVALAPAPVLIVGVLLFGSLLATYVIPLFETESSEFTTACRDAGSRFFRTPAMPVHSIAYGPSPNTIGTYKTGLYGRLTQIGGFDAPMPRFDAAIEFTEHRRGYGDGITSTDSGLYVRLMPKSNDLNDRYRGNVVESLTADVLVTYRIFPKEELAKAPIAQGPVTHELTVTDRRDGQTIASMRYVIDQKGHHICGPMTNNVLSEKAFLAQALGLD